MDKHKVEHCLLLLYYCRITFIPLSSCGTCNEAVVIEYVHDHIMYWKILSTWFVEVKVVITGF
jgi:hypothetical protein